MLIDTIKILLLIYITHLLIIIASFMLYENCREYQEVENIYTYTECFEDGLDIVIPFSIGKLTSKENG
jgi:hypothetical protein